MCALKFTKKTTDDQTAPSTPKSETTSHKPKFLTGASAKKALHEEETKMKAKQEAAGKAFRFRLPYKPGEDNETQLTFLDGELDDDGILDIQYYREHTVKKDGYWQNILCTDDEEGYCPICEKGENSSVLVGYLSVLDHTPYTTKSGDQITISKKLFVAKRSTLQLLTKKAIKLGGLTGATFDVMRTGDREAAVGNQFDLIEKSPLAELAEANDWKPELIEPLDYEEELVYHTAAELAEMGMGPALSGPGTESKIDESELASKM